MNQDPEQEQQNQEQEQEQDQDQQEIISQQGEPQQQSRQPSVHNHTSHHHHHHQQPMVGSFGPGTMSYGGQPMTRSIKGGSRVEYFPIERRQIEYETVEKVITEQVPQTRIEYVPVEKKIIEHVPKEKVITDYQAVEYQREYVPRIQYDIVQEQVPVQRTEYVPVTRVEYVPKERIEYITQSRQVERVEYDEIEYQVQRPQVQNLGASHVVVNPPSQHLHRSQVIVNQPQQLQRSQVLVHPPMAQSIVRPLNQSTMASTTVIRYPPGFSSPSRVKEQAKRAPQPEEKGILDQIFD